jgi:hypothetical protein
MNTTELLRVGRASALVPAGRNAGGAFFRGCFGTHDKTIKPNNG